LPLLPLLFCGLLELSFAEVPVARAPALLDKLSNVFCGELDGDKEGRDSGTSCDSKSINGNGGRFPYEDIDYNALWKISLFIRVNYLLSVYVWQILELFFL
jgi:hypothetical protein